MALGAVVIALLCAQVLGNREHDLSSALLDNYPEPVTVRPLANPSSSQEVGLRYMLLNIVGMDEDNAVLTLHGWMSMSWTDSYMTWNPADYDGIGQLQVDLSKIWTPDIVGFDSFKDEVTHRLGALFSNGMVVSIIPITSRVTCQHDERGSVTCPLKFGSWSTSKDIMSLNYLNNETTIDMSAFHEHPELEIQHSDVRIAEKQYPCCPDTTYQSYEISLTVGMRRHGRDRGERNDVPGARGQRWEEEEEPRLDMMRGYN